MRSPSVVKLCLVLLVICLLAGNVEAGKKNKKSGGVFKKIGKAVSKTTKSVGKAVSQAANVVADKVEDAGKTVASASKTVIQKTGKGLDTAWKKSSRAVVQTTKKAARFTQNAIDEMESIAQDVAQNVVKYANALEGFVGSLGCAVKPADIKDLAKQLVSLNPKTIDNLRDPQSFASFADGARSVQMAMCATAWTQAEVSNPAIILATFLGKLKGSCAALSKVNPALSFGVGVAASTSAGQSVDTSAEFGLAMDSNGNKFCYIGGCVARGMTLPPIPDADADVGFSIAFWKHPSAIPGSSKEIGVSGEIALLGVGLEFGLNFISSGTIGQGASFLGVSLTGEVGPDKPASASFGVASASCLTPVCISTTGGDCE
jgi:hypothetical protein